MMTIQKVRAWLDSLPGGHVGVDEGGLTLLHVRDGRLSGASLEVGGLPEEIENPDDGP